LFYEKKYIFLNKKYMKKFILIILVLSTFISCKTEEKHIGLTDTFSLKQEINKSIVDGFFDGDSTKIPKGTYFLK